MDRIVTVTVTTPDGQEHTFHGEGNFSACNAAAVGEDPVHLVIVHLIEREP